MRTFSEFRLLRLTIEAFRGFRDAAEFDLDATSVLFTGPNGTGKTSVFDAFQWLLLGTIERLAGLRGRKNVEHIVNTYRRGGRADVALQVVADGRPVTIRRGGRYNDSTLEIAVDGEPSRFGDEAEAWLRSSLVPHDSEVLATMLTTCGLLQQDVMRSVLEAKASERYRHISAILGMGELEEFEGTVRDLAREAASRSEAAREGVRKAEEAVRGAEAHVDGLRQGGSRRTSVEVVRRMLRECTDRTPTHMRVEVPETLTPEDARGIAARCRQLRDDVRSLMERASSLVDYRAGLSEEPTSEQQESLARGIDEAVGLIRSAEADQRIADTALASVRQKTTTTSFYGTCGWFEW